MAAKTPAEPITVTPLTARDDSDAIEGQFLVTGAGVYGTYEHTATYDPETGYPDRILVRPRDSSHLIVVDHADCLPSSPYRR